MNSKTPTRGAAGVAKNLASKFASFGKKNRNQIAIGGGIIGILTTAAFLIFSLAPLKVVGMMENLTDYNWRRNNEAFEKRRNRIVKNFLGQKAGIVNADGSPVGDNIPESERPFYQKIFRRMAGDNKFVRELRNSGYVVDVDTNYRTLKIWQATSSDIDSRITNFEVVDEYDLLTEKSSARKEINKIVSRSTQDDGWFKRIYERRRMQKSTGTKWHWLDPVNQPINRLKKKVATEIIDYSLKNKITAKFASKIIAGILGIEPEKLNLDIVSEKIAKESAENLAEEVAQEGTQALTNSASKEIAEKAVRESVEKLASEIGSKIASVSNPVGIVLAIVGIVCTTNNLADNAVMQEAVNGYATFQYMLTYTKWESVSSQVKNGNNDGKLGTDELNANLDLLSSPDGKDIGASNNYRRASGEQIPYDPNSKTANDCESGKELCKELQPRCAIFSTQLGRAWMATIVRYFASGQYTSSVKYCKSVIEGKENTLDGIINTVFNQLDPIGAIAGSQFASARGTVIDGICRVYDIIVQAVDLLVNILLSAFEIGCKASGALGPQLNPACTTYDKLKDFVSLAVDWLSEKVLAPLLVPVISDQIRGPQLANAIAAGADFNANESLRSLNGKPLSQAEATASEKRYYASLREDHNKANLADKIFSKNQYSLVNQLLKFTPTHPSTISSSMLAYVKSLSNPGLAIQNIKEAKTAVLQMITPKAIAAEPYVNPFGLRLTDEGRPCEKDQSLQCVYGYSEDQLDAPLGSESMKALDKEVACSIVANIEPGDLEKPDECIKAEDEANGDTGGGTGNGGAQDTPGNIVWPLPNNQKGTIGSCYGNRAGGFHGGIDISGVEEGTPVSAYKAGRITYVLFRDPAAGNAVAIDHGDGTFSRYLHLQDGSITVNNGEEVEKGQVIGKLGNTGHSTGPHLHFEINTGAAEARGVGRGHNPLYYLSSVLSGVYNRAQCPLEDVAI